MDYETVVLIPTYNGKHLLNDCLSSIQNQTYRNFKIVIADDASTDETGTYLQNNFPDVDVFRCEINKGFVETVNKGITYILKKYSPRFIAILNNDTRADTKWIESLVARIKEGADIAAVTSNMFFYDHPEIINSQGGTIDWNGDGYDINFGMRGTNGKEESGKVIGACFGASLIQSATFRTVGLLDERFGAYFEDLDWSWRANIFGYRVIFEKNAVIYHKHSASYQKMPYKKLFLCKKNALRAAIKNYEAKNLPRYLTYILIGYWFALVGYFQKKSELSLPKKFVFASIPLGALVWNLIYLPNTMRERQNIQKNRKSGDDAIIALAAQDLTPVRIWIKNIKGKFFIWKHFIPITEHTKHRVVLPFFNFTKHRVALPIVYKIKNLNDQFMQKNLFGKVPFSESVDAETIDVYFETVLANLPFQFTFIEKNDFFKNESSFIIDACMTCLQFSFYKNPPIFQQIRKKISDASIYLKQNQIDWNKTAILGMQANASSQLYFYLRLIEEFSDTRFPKKIIRDLKQNGSRIQNVLFDQINLSGFFSKKPSFFLKLYSKMYLESGFLRYMTSKMHAWHNNGFQSIKKEEKEDGVYPVRNPSRQGRDGNHLERFISNGINIFGFIDSESGVGEASRTLIRAIDRGNIPYALLNSDRAPHRRRETQFSKKFGNVNPYPINLIAIYGDMFGSELNRFGKEKFEHHYNIAYWAWELSALPPEWIPLLDTVNEVWTPSIFSAHAIRKAKNNMPITVIPHAIEIKKCPYARKRFGLPEHMFLFLFMFDFYSIFERKNPLAVIRAFVSAFTENENVALIIKCSNEKVDPENFEKLTREAKRKNIFLIHEYLERDEISSLINVCDCYVSLHRSEGFGLSIAEAMALRKPVIATDYSGNADFMNEENSFPVSYTLIPLEQDYGPYKMGNIWANPNENEATKYMRLVFDQREVAARKGMFAERYVMEHLSPESVASSIKKRLKKIFWE